MKTPLLNLALSFIALIAATGRADEAIAFVDVSVLPLDTDRAVPGQTVLVRGDRIVHVGLADSVAVPEGARRIEGRGRYLMPGLAEMHGHNPPPGSSDQYVADVYFLFLANGVTTVRSMLGWPGQLELRERVQKGELLGPNLYLAGPSFSGQSTPGPSLAGPRVRQQHGEGWDLLKVHPGLTRETYDAMADAAHEVGIAFGGHIPAGVGLLHAIDRGQLTIDHLDGYIEFLEGDRGPLDPEKLAHAVGHTRAAGVAVVPTMVLWETILGSADAAALHAFPELQYMPRDEVERWKAQYERRLRSETYFHARARRIAENRKILLRALNEGGVEILFGTDAPQQFSVPGFSIHREVAAMAESGMTPLQILASATRAVGAHLRDWDRFGNVAAGSRADLLLLEANPLEDLTALRHRAGVMVRGRWLPEEEIQRGLGEIAARNAKN